MYTANKVFHLRQRNDPSHPLYAAIGMTESMRSVESQIETIIEYKFEEVIHLSDIEANSRERLISVGIKLTKVALEKKGKSLDTIYLIENGESLKNFDIDDRILWVMNSKSCPTAVQLQEWIKTYPHLYFYFAPKNHLHEDLLSCREIYYLMKKIEPQKMRPYPGLNVYETRAPVDLIFFPRNGLLWSEGDTHNRVKHSIIIPVYGQKIEALRTIERLLFQATKDPYEVLVVDDGDNEDLSLQLKKLLSQKHQLTALKYLVNPRIYPRQMGDHRFRAGISRNFALRFARGSQIHFLDADVLVPRTYIDTVSEELNHAQLVQIQRYDLTQDFTKSMRPIEEIDKEVDIIYGGRDYWYDFFKKGVGWMDLKCPWKYVCTYGISMHRDYLQSIGGIRTNYIFYGFEDTDLGLRVWKSGGRFKLSAVMSYHQFHEERRSEFKNSNRLRRKLMAQSGKLFFLNNLDSIIYEELIDYLFPRYSAGEWINFLFFNWWREPKKMKPKKIPVPLVS
jgi:glycosyltransferase involved in cell wall biosynthesis